jgi:hypothetical protein
MDTTEMSKLFNKGLFGPQTAYQQRVIFQAFAALTQTPGADFTLGIADVRRSDGAESVPQLSTFVVRSTDD